MAANVEWMFSGNSVTPWHGIGEIVKGTLTSEEAIKVAKLDWDVTPQPIFDANGKEIKGYKANTRSSDGKILGLVTNRYSIVQNRVGFGFTDELVGTGRVQYETAGSLKGGKEIFLLARLDDSQFICEEKVDKFIVFTNTHDGTGAVRAAITPVRVVCANTLNLALRTAKRHWSCAHKGNIMNKLEEARYTLQSADRYMEALEEEFGELKLKKITEADVKNMTEILLKSEFEDLYKKANTISDKVIDFKAIQNQQKYEEKLNRKRSDILNIYFDKPDLRGTEHTAFRFVNAISDYATHTMDHKNTRNYQENLFMKTVDGHSMIDRAYEIARAA